MNTYFISDLHLQTSDSAITKIFLRFLNKQALTADALYILGDLFEVWIGDDDNTHFANAITSALKKLTASGVKVYFMRGNRDFAIGQRFATTTGITLLTDPSVIDLYGKKILLMHGDLLCTDDQKYQTFRRKVYQPKFQARLLRLPLWVRRLIAAWARYQSKKHTQTTDLIIQDVNQNTVQHYLQKYQVDLLIHGHTHRPATHHLNFNGQPAQRIVLAAWHQHGHLLSIDRQGQIKHETLLA